MIALVEHYPLRPPIDPAFIFGKVIITIPVRVTNGLGVVSPR